MAFCSSFSTLYLSFPHPQHCTPVPKQLSTCQRDPPCPMLSHHSILPLPWDKSNHLFLHLWQTISPSTIHPLFRAHVSVCHLPRGPPLHTCAMLPVQFLSVTPGCVTERDRVTVLSHARSALCSRALSGRYMYNIYTLFIHTSIKGSTVWQSERCDSLTNLWLFFGQNMRLASPPRAQYYKARQISYYFPGLYKALSHEFSWTIPKWRGIITKHCIKISSLPSPLLFHFPSKMNLCPVRLKHNIKELVLF